MSKNKNINAKDSGQAKWINSKDYTGSKAGVRTFALFLLVFFVGYSLYSVWQVRQWTKKQRVQVIRLAERDLQDLSQWIIRASISGQADYAQLLKKYIKEKAYISQISFVSRENQIFTATQTDKLVSPAWLESWWPTQDERISYKVTIGQIDFGQANLMTNGAYARLNVLAAWEHISLVIAIFMAMAGVLFSLYLRRSARALQAIAVCGHQIHQGNYTARIYESGSSEMREAIRYVNVLAATADLQAQHLEKYKSSTLKGQEIIKDVTAEQHKIHQVNVSKSQYLANISDEFRGPLNSILALTEMSMKSEFKAQQRHFNDMIHASAIQLQDFIDRVMDIAFLESNDARMVKSIFDFRAMMRQVQGAMKPVLGKRAKLFEMSTDNDIPQYVIGDESRMRQILMSALCASVKTNFNKLSLQATIIKTDVVSVTIQFKIVGVNDKSASIAVENKYTGAVDADVDAICNIYANTGVGAMVAQKLVKAMDGELSEPATNEQLYSHKFTLRFDRPSQAQLLEYEKIQESKDKQAKRIFRVLLAESHLINRYVFELVFFHKGYVTIKAETGKEALEKLQSERIDFAVIDAQLPVLDGLSLVQTWRAQEKDNKYLPIIFLTSDARLDSIAKAKQYVDCVEVKPISPYRIIEDIEALLKNPPVRSIPETLENSSINMNLNVLSGESKLTDDTINSVVLSTKDTITPGSVKVPD